MGGVAGAPPATPWATEEGATTSTHGILASWADRPPFSLERILPGPAVAERVERYWVTRWDLRGEADHVQEILPHPCVNLVAYSGIVRVHGIPLQRDVRRLQGSGCAIGTKFRPGAFAAFCRVPMPALRGGVLTLEQAFGPDGRGLEERILAAVPDVAAVTAAVEAHLAPRMPGEDRAFALVRDVAADMLRRAPEARVSAIARDHGVSERTLQRVFREQVGVGPKWVLRRYRVHEAAERIAHGDGARPTDLGRLAQELGYADQAHFANDFREAVGRTPTEYARACGQR